MSWQRYLLGGNDENGKILQPGYPTFGSHIVPEPPESEAEVPSTWLHL